MTDLGSVLHSGKRSDLELNDLLQHLKIREDEDQEIVLEEDLEGLKARCNIPATPGLAIVTSDSYLGS
jgi:hypothetical protein